MLEMSSAPNRPPRGRLFVGGVIFVGGFLAPVLVPLVARSGLSTEWKTVVSGLLVLGVPELFMLIAVAILGKPGFDYLKSRLLGAIAPAEHVSRGRYRLGLVLFMLPLFLGWAAPYLSHWLPGYEQWRLAYAVAGDVLFVVSLFVLGGEFWDKLRALFVHDARATLPKK